MQSVPEKLFILKFVHQTYPSYRIVHVHTAYGLVKKYDRMWSEYDVDIFIEGLKFGLPFTVIEIIDKTKPEEPPDEITNLRGESKEQETEDDVPF